VSAQSNIVLRTEDIQKFFYHPVEFHVLKDITLEIKNGEFVSIMGKSGSGKSTLLYVLSTMDTRYEGKLYLNNRLVTGMSHNELARIRNQEIGFVFQFHYLLPEFSVLKNVMIPALKLGRKTRHEIEKDARRKLDILAIAQLADKKASQVSGGEKQRVAIARALINEPSIVMGDEPTGNLDSKNSDNVFRIMRELASEKGLSMLMVTHDEDFAARTDRTIYLEDGRIIDHNRQTGKDKK